MPCRIQRRGSAGCGPFLVPVAGGSRRPPASSRPSRARPLPPFLTNPAPSPSYTEFSAVRRTRLAPFRYAAVVCEASGRGTKALLAALLPLLSYCPCGSTAGSARTGRGCRTPYPPDLPPSGGTTPGAAISLLSKGRLVSVACRAECGYVRARVRQPYPRALAEELPRGRAHHPSRA